MNGETSQDRQDAEIYSLLAAAAQKVGQYYGMPLEDVTGAALRHQARIGGAQSGNGLSYPASVDSGNSSIATAINDTANRLGISATDVMQTLQQVAASRSANLSNSAASAYSSLPWPQFGTMPNFSFEFGNGESNYGTP